MLMMKDKTNEPFEEFLCSFFFFFSIYSLGDKHTFIDQLTLASAFGSSQ